MTENQETWQSRVTEWRASGKTAAEFSARQGFAASTLRWWSSRLQRNNRVAAPAVATPMVRLAKVVRSAEPADLVPMRRGAVIIEMLDGHVRVVVEAGADRETLSTVLDLVGKVAR